MSIIFPRAFAFAVDDMGWNEGASQHRDGGEGPARVGINRRMTLADYKALVDVGKAVGVRVQGLFVLCDMDRDNACARYPTTTMFGAGWDNRANVRAEQTEIMEYVKENAAHLEFGLHGVGHEHWGDDRRRVRAEWYDIENDKSWPEEDLRAHLDCYREILAQYGLSPENGHSFPKSFVPCAYSYWWNPDGTYSLGTLLGELGVKYANTLFEEVRELNPPEGDNGGGFDHGVHVINRVNYGNEWFSLASLPTVPLCEQASDVIETHWPNWLAADPSDQETMTRRFIEYYRAVQRSEDRYAAKNTEQLHSQWLYRRYAKVTEISPGEVVIDNSAMPAEAYEHGLLGPMILKVPLGDGFHVSRATIDGAAIDEAAIDGSPIASYFEDSGFGFLYLPVLERKEYRLLYSVSEEAMPFYVWNDDTFSVYSVHSREGATVIDLAVYGKQTVRIHCAKPESVQLRGANISMSGERYDGRSGCLELDLSAGDIQGSRGLIVLR